MLNIKKILLPVDFPHVSLRVIHQAATLAQHFHSELVLLHVVTPASQNAGGPDASADLAGWDLLEEIVRTAQESMDQALGPELDGLTIQRALVKGDPAQTIVATAQQEKADLIMMPPCGFTFDQFLLGSMSGTECPVWTSAYVEELPAHNFAIRNVLCAVDFRPHSRRTVLWAEHLATEFGAHLTLADVTSNVELWGPGGSYVNAGWKDALIADASQHVAELQHDTGVKADVFIGSGDVPKVLGQAVKQTKADLVVTGCRPYGGYLRTHGYAIIRAVPVPVLCVGGC